MVNFCCKFYADKAYGLKCEHIPLLPRLPSENGFVPIFTPLPSQRLTYVILYPLYENQREFTSHLEQLKLLIKRKTPQSKIILTPKYYWHLQLKLLIRQVGYFTKQ